MADKDKKQSQSGSPFKRDHMRNQKQEFICQIASDLFNKNGFAATSLDEVADKLNISKPSIYYYYTNKSELLLGCYNRTLDICEDLLAQILAANGTGLDKLCSFGEKLITLHCAAGKIAVVSDVHALPDNARARVQQRSKQLTDGLETIVKLGMSDGSIRDIDVAVFTRFMMGGINWMPKWHDEEGDASPQEIARTYTDFLRAGIGQTKA